MIGVTLYQFSQLEGTNEFNAARAPLLAPVVQPPPSLRVGAPERSAISRLEVWGLKPLAPQGNLPSLKDMFKPFYTLNRNGRFESIQRSDRPAEQWQFQGVLLRGGVMRALFYNPALKKLKNLGHGELVDDRLVIRAIGSSNVTLEVLGEKKPRKFDLRLFNANKESYVAKRKTL